MNELLKKELPGHILYREGGGILLLYMFTESFCMKLTCKKLAVFDSIGEKTCSVEVCDRCNLRRERSFSPHDPTEIATDLKQLHDKDDAINNNRIIIDIFRKGASVFLTFYNIKPEVVTRQYKFTVTSGNFSTSDFNFECGGKWTGLGLTEENQRRDRLNFHRQVLVHSTSAAFLEFNEPTPPICGINFTN